MPQRGATPNDRGRARVARRLAESLKGSEPVPVSEWPDWILSPRELDERERRIRQNPDAFLGWRLGWLAEHMTGRRRERCVDAAIAAFAAIRHSPIGPGNDDGPFCDLAPVLTLRQVVRVARVIAAMERAGGWGDELGAAKGALVARLHELGSRRAAAELLAPLNVEDQAYAARRIVGERPRRPVARTLERASTHDVEAWTVAECEARLMRWLARHRGRSDLGRAVVAHPVALAVRRVGGAPAMARLRRLLRGKASRSR